MTLQRHIDSAYNFGKSVAKAPSSYHDIGMIEPEITAAEEELFPISSMPSQNDDWDNFVKWNRQRLDMGQQLWDAYASGVESGKMENS